MKIRRLADAAIVAALLAVSIPDLQTAVTPENLLHSRPLPPPVPYDMMEKTSAEVDADVHPAHRL